MCLPNRQSCQTGYRKSEDAVQVSKAAVNRFWPYQIRGPTVKTRCFVIFLMVLRGGFFAPLEVAASAPIGSSRYQELPPTTFEPTASRPRPRHLVLYSYTFPVEMRDLQA